MELALNKTDLHPKNLPKEILEEKVFDEDRYLDTERFCRKYVRKEKALLFKFLKDENDAALVLTRQESEQTGRRLNEEGVPSTSVHIGKENVWEPIFGALLAGVFPYGSKAVKLLKLWDQTGIAERWRRLITPELNIQPKNIQPKSASLDGHISVIFVVFAIGILLSLLKFVTECGRMIPERASLMCYLGLARMANACAGFHSKVAQSKSKFVLISRPPRIMIPEEPEIKLEE